MTLGLRKKIYELSVFRTCSRSAYRYSFDVWYIAFHTKLQIKFEFGYRSLILHEVMVLGLREISQLVSFLHFSLSAYRYSFDIWYIAFHTKLQIKFEFGYRSLILHEVMVLGLREISQLLSFLHLNSLSAYRYSFDIWYIALQYQVTDQVRVWFRSNDFSRSYGPWTSHITNDQLIPYRLCSTLKFILLCLNCFRLNSVAYIPIF
jgi:hypothetical protein